MIRKIGALFLAVCIVLIMAGVAMALETVRPQAEPVTEVESSGNAVYVSASGDDEKNSGRTTEDPVASLDKAFLIAESGDTIYLLTDVEAKSRALISGKTVTIDGNGHTITRAEDFVRAQDQGRGGYHSAMIEVANKSELTLLNITLDDKFLREANEFSLAGSSTEDNTGKAHDGIIASYGDGHSTIILGDGATLKNFGGLSAVYITGENGEGAKLILKSGSKICDDQLGKREGGYAAIFNHGGTVQAEKNSTVENIDGRAIYADNGGVTKFAGTIKDITSNEVVKQPGDAGTAYYGDGNTVFTLASGGSIENIKSHDGTAADSALHLIGCTFKTEKDSHIKNLSVGVADMNGATVDIAGAVTECSAKDVFFRMRGTQGTFTLQKTGSITKCDADTALIYLNGGKPTVTIAGTIDDINVTAIFMSNNGPRKDGAVTLADTGKIANITGYGMRLEDASKVTIAGTITDCSDYAVQYYPKGNQSLLTIKSSATIENNNGGKAQIRAQNILPATDAQEHIVIEPGGLDGNTTVDLAAFDVTLDTEYELIKLGNAKSAAVTAIKNIVDDKYPGWTVAASTYSPKAVWIQPLADEVHFTVDRFSYMKKTALYVVLIPLNEDGTPVDDAELILQEVENTDTVDVTLTGLTAGQSYAMMFVNNAEYTLTPDDITIYTGGGQGNEAYDDGFPEVTLINSIDLSYVKNPVTNKYGYDLKSLEVNGVGYTATAEKSLVEQLAALVEATYTYEDNTVAADDSKSGEYAVTLSWKDGLNDEDVRVNGNNVNLDGEGTLIVRHTNDVEGAQDGTTTHELLTSEPNTPITEHAEAIAPSNSKFYTNGDTNRAVDASGIRLLDDSLLLEGDDNRQELMEQKAAEYLGAPGEGRAYRYEFHYLDLVDAFNGNAWVSASNGTTIYLPYPEGVTADNADELGVKVVHYKGLHREYGIAGQADVEDAIAASELETMKVEFTDYGIKFDVPRAGFSPFAVVWQTEAHTITAMAGAGGSIDPEGEITVAKGADQTFTFTPDAGYTLDTVTVDGQPVPVEGNSYTISNVNSNMTIRVTFKSNSGGGGSGGGSGSAHVTTDRIGGDDRFETAVKVAERLKSKLGVKKFDTIIVADSDDFADALSAAPLASEKDAPILVVNERSEKYVKDYIDAHLSANGKVYIIGETAAVSGGFERSLTAHKVTRLGGADRYETNLKVLKELNLKEELKIMVASGQDYPDALSASATGNPILLVKSGIFDYQKDYLETLGGDDDYFVIGGTAAVNEKVMDQLEKFDEDGVSRVWGDDRFETAKAVADRFYRNARAVYIASGCDFPDALTGGVIAYKNNAPLLLVSESKYSEAARFVDTHNVRKVTAIGGPAAVSDKVLRAVAR